METQNSASSAESIRTRTHRTRDTESLDETLLSHRSRDLGIQQVTRRDLAEDLGASLSEIQAPTSAIRSRLFEPTSDRLIRPVRHRRHDRPNFSTNAGTIQQAVDSLNTASTGISSLSQEPVLLLNTPYAAIARAHYGEEGSRRRAKRRKLDEEYPLGFKAINYGYRGQVVSGALKMEIVSCDGGLHADSRHGREYWPENVLRNDKSVYCTDSSKCNIIMRHQGGTTFCLKKLVIKAPDRGFTAPYGFVADSTRFYFSIRANTSSQHTGGLDLHLYDRGRPTRANSPLSSPRTFTITNRIPGKPYWWYA